MKLLRRLAYLVLIFVMAAIIIQNRDELGRSVPFSFLRWNISLVLGFWIFLSFAAGGILFMIFDAGRNFKLRWQLRSRDQQIAQLQAEAAAATKNAAGSSPAAHTG